MSDREAADAGCIGIKGLYERMKISLAEGYNGIGHYNSGYVSLYIFSRTNIYVWDK